MHNHCVLKLVLIKPLIFSLHLWSSAVTHVRFLNCTTDKSIINQIVCHFLGFLVQDREQEHITSCVPGKDQPWHNVVFQGLSPWGIVIYKGVAFRYHWAQTRLCAYRRQSIDDSLLYPSTENVSTQMITFDQLQTVLTVLTFQKVVGPKWRKASYYCRCNAQSNLIQPCSAES